MSKRLKRVAITEKNLRDVNGFRLSRHKPDGRGGYRIVYDETFNQVLARILKATRDRYKVVY